MIKSNGTFLLIVVLFATQHLVAQNNLSEHLTGLGPFIGKTWKAEVGKSEDGQITYDVQKWERVLNGNGVRLLHSVNKGDYGGETIFIWDRKSESVVYYYFTTAGFYTQGSVSFEGKRMISHEYVEGNKEGITEVKSISELTDDNKILVTTKMLKKGEWIDRGSVTYVEDSSAEVVFK